MSFAVHVGYDESEKVYYVLSSDIAGLNVEAPTFEEFVNIARDVAPDLLPDRPADITLSFQHVVEFAA